MTERVIELEPGLRRLLAPNPSPMTGDGTNTYLLGERDLVVIDPGPDDDAHLAAILAETAGRVALILVTHSHRDHSALCPRLAAATGAPVAAFGDSWAGRSATMAALAETGIAGGGEGVDPGFAPDRLLADGEQIGGDGWRLTALHTPGHFGNHMSFAWNGALFTGDTVMGWASTLVSPPDGDLTDFMASLDRLQACRAHRLYPGHGAPVDDPQERIAWLAAHRRGREAQIRDALSAGPATAAALTERLYTDTPPALHPAARRNVFAHLLDLATRGHATAAPAPSPDALWTLT